MRRHGIMPVERVNTLPPKWVQWGRLLQGETAHPADFPIRDKTVVAVDEPYSPLCFMASWPAKGGFRVLM